MTSHCEMGPAVRRRSHRFNRCRRARQANNGQEIRHGAAGGRYYSQKSQSERRTHCTGVGNIRWKWPFHRPSPTGLSQIVFTMGSLFFDFRKQRR
ncbi:hypothetical protein AVEN_83496-1 [Araneus ventricosus]|uniref:Uncharacterized protein n=1 Tax=Araneus ventricosus TaxID=182803 RepID=A0A4Y2MXJ8_ARAVE|nr:hypothetical protein AVEN_83496-1 [Araneus ventricosus]